MPGTVKSELLSDADRSHKCDSQEKVCWIWHLPLDKSHFITAFGKKYASFELEKVNKYEVSGKNLKDFLNMIDAGQINEAEMSLCLYTENLKKSEQKNFCRFLILWNKYYLR